MAYSTSAPNTPLKQNVPSGTATQSGDLTGDGHVVKEGVGSLSLTGTNTLTGGTVLRAGTLRVGSDTLSSGSLAIRNGTTLGNLSTDADAFLDNSVNVQGDFTLDVQGSQGSLELTGAVDFTGTPNASVNLTSDGLACFSGAVTGLTSPSNRPIQTPACRFAGPTATRSSAGSPSETMCFWNRSRPVAASHRHGRSSTTIATSPLPRSPTRSPSWPSPGWASWPCGGAKSNPPAAGGAPSTLQSAAPRSDVPE